MHRGGLYGRETITEAFPMVVTVLDALGTRSRTRPRSRKTRAETSRRSWTWTPNGQAEFTLGFGAHRFEANIGGTYHTSGALGSCVVSRRQDSADSGGDVHRAPMGTACNDGNACTQTDTCQAGTLHAAPTR